MSEIPFNVLKSVENTIKPPTPSGGYVRQGRARARGTSTTPPAPRKGFRGNRGYGAGEPPDGGSRCCTSPRRVLTSRAQVQAFKL